MLRSLLLAALATFLIVPDAASQTTPGAWPGCDGPGVQGHGGQYELIFGVVRPIGVTSDYAITVRDASGTVLLDTLRAAVPSAGLDTCVEVLSARTILDASNPANGVKLGSPTPAGRLLTFTFEERDASNPFAPALYSQTFTYNVCASDDAQSETAFYCSTQPYNTGGGQAPASPATDFADYWFYYDGTGLYTVHVYFDSDLGPGKAFKGFEDVFAGEDWVMPYNLTEFCDRVDFACNALAVRQQNNFLSNQSGDPVSGSVHTPILRDWTLGPGDIVLDPAPPMGSLVQNWLWNLTGQTVFLQPGQRILANNAFDIDDMAVAAHDATQGWDGIHYAAGSTGTLTDATISGVRITAPPGGDPFSTPVIPDAGAITATDADVTLDGGTEVFGTVDGFGVFAEGAATVTIGGSSSVENNGRYGAKAVGGAQIVLDGQLASITGNTDGGVFTSDASFRGFRGSIAGNQGPGVQATFQGTAELVRALGGSGSSSFAGTAGTVTVDLNRGGLYASGIGSVTSVVPACAQPPCDPVNEHAITDNVPADTTGVFDASALGSSGVTSNDDFWGTGITETCTSSGGTTNSACQLVVETDGSSAVSIDPAGGTSTAKHGGTSASRGGGVWDAVRAAETAAAQGDLDGALAAATLALDGAFTDGEIGAAYGLAARLARRHRMPVLTALLTARSTLPGAARAHALYALGAAHDGAGRSAAARTAYAEAAEHADGPLALAAHRARIGLAVRTDDLAGVRDALGGFLAAEPSDAQIAEVAGRVLRAFPDASFTDVRPAPPVAAKAGTIGASSALAAWPNPAAGAAEVRFTLDAAGPARLSVYDALGREVAVLADGEREAGPHTARLDTAGLAPGVYLVRLATGGAEATTQLTVVR